MSRVPLAIGATAFGATGLASVAFVSDSIPIDQSAAVMILVGIMGSSLAALAGLLLVRAPWGRWLLALGLAASILLASVGGTALFWVSLTVGSAAVVGLVGPWLTLWVRQQPVAEKLGIVPVALITAGIGAPVVVGLASWDGVHWFHWALVAVTGVASWTYGRGISFGIWGFKVAVPVAGVFVALNTSQPGSYLLLVAVVATAGAAWSRAARRVTALITPPLPRPTARRESRGTDQ